MAVLKILPYTRDNVLRLLGNRDAPLPAQARAAVEYVHDYLARLKPLSIVHEDSYVDRHYLEDYAAYYARSFAAPGPVCERLHFFADHDDTKLSALLERAYAEKGKHEEIEQQIAEEQCYLGFVVRRPLGACIGRTVLRTYPVEAKRHYEVVRPYEVNIAGLRLRIDGLAYQEQDRGAAVCASTSLWVALQRVAHVAGHRTPTPSAITKAAASPFPASEGLTLGQMANALASLGYIADLFEPKDNRALFRALITTCLQSQRAARDRRRAG
jgi:hypothetical protein